MEIFFKAYNISEGMELVNCLYIFFFYVCSTFDFIISGSFLGGLFRAVFPLLRKSGMAIGREVSRGAAGLLDDLDHHVDVKTAFKARGNEVFNNLKRKATDVMNGDGAKKQKTSKARQSSVNRLKSKSKKPAQKPKKKSAAKKKKKVQKSKTTTRDYFS